MAKVRIEIALKNDLLFELLQHIRDFDARHMQDVEVKIGVDAPDVPGEEIKHIFASIHPPFPLVVTGKADSN